MDWRIMGFILPLSYVSIGVDLDETIELITHEWKRKRGNKLELSELSCLETLVTMNVYNMFNAANLTTIQAEAKRMMAKATTCQAEDGIAEE